MSAAGFQYPGAFTTTPSRPRPPSGGRFVTPNVPSAIARSRPSSPIRRSSPVASASTWRARAATSPSGSGRKLSPSRPAAART